MWRYKCSECPCGAPYEPDERIRELEEEEKKGITHSWLKGTVAVVFAMSRRQVRDAATHAINV